MERTSIVGMPRSSFFSCGAWTRTDLPSIQTKKIMHTQYGLVLYTTITWFPWFLKAKVPKWLQLDTPWGDLSTKALKKTRGPSSQEQPRVRRRWPWHVIPNQTYNVVKIVNLTWFFSDTVYDTCLTPRKPLATISCRDRILSLEVDLNFDDAGRSMKVQIFWKHWLELRLQGCKTTSMYIYIYIIYLFIYRMRYGQNKRRLL